LLERRQLLRSLITSATVRSIGPGTIDLDARIEAPRRWTGLVEPLVTGPTADRPVRVRIEVLAGPMLRVRVAPDEPGDGDTPMLAVPVAALEPIGVEPIVDGSTVRFELGAHAAEVSLHPFRLTVVDDAGRTVAEVGGPEKNVFGVWDAWGTGISHTGGGLPVAHEVFALRPGEAIWGLGEQFGRFDRVGQTIDLTMEEANGTGTPRAYKNVPFWISSHGYGVFVNQSSRMTVWVGSRSAPDLQLAVEDDHLDWFLFLGKPKDVLQAYTGLTGRAPVPPRWSFGFWQSKISYGSQAEVLDVVRRQRAAGVPMDVVHVDTNWFRRDWCCDLEFDPERFPDPAGMAAELRDLGVHLSLWQLPYIPEGSSLFDDLAAVDGFAKTADGDLYDVGICMTRGYLGRVGLIDFTNPAAVEVYQRYLRAVLDAGASVIKVDFGESAPLDAVWHDGTAPHLMHNRYPLLYQRAVAEVTEAATGSPIIWARAAWAGCQRYPVHWGGDNSANWHSLGPQLAAGLGMAMSGFAHWSEDIGGFAGLAGGDLLVRWTQLGVLHSHARIHGFGERELDRFEASVRDRCIAAIRLRYRLLPYLWSIAADAAATGVPLMRPLALEFPDDPTTWPIGDQWLLGDALLVAPVLDPFHRRRAYLPEGRWQDWWTGDIVDGNRWLDLDVPIDRIPLWLRAGHILPLAPPMNHVDERPIDRLEIRLLPGGEAQHSRVVPLDDERVVTVRSSRGPHGVVLDVSGAAVDLVVADAVGVPIDATIELH